MRKFLLMAFGFFACASLAITGYLAVQEELAKQDRPTASAHVQKPQAKSTAKNTTVDLVCIVRNRNAKLADDKIVQAIAQGVERHGVKTRAVPHNQVPKDCRLCLYYGVTSENGKTKSFDFQAVLDGKALKRGSGGVAADGNVKIKTISDYAYNYLKSIIVAKKNGAKSN